MTTVTVTLELTQREARDLEAASTLHGRATSFDTLLECNIIRSPDKTSHWDKLARALRRAMQTPAQRNAQQTVEASA